MSSDQSDLGSLVVEALLISGSIGHAVIEVEELAGTITLKGTVESEQARLTAEALVQEQEGVVQVINQLRTAGLQARDTL